MRYQIRRINKQWQVALQDSVNSIWSDNLVYPDLFDSKDEAINFSDQKEDHAITTEIDPIENESGYRDILLSQGKTEDEIEGIIKNFRKQYGT